MPLTVRRPGESLSVLMIHARYRHDGGEDISARAEAGSLKARGHSVDLLELPPSPSVWAVLSSTWLGWWNGALYREVRRRLSRQQVDVVHCQNLFPAATPAVIAAARDEGCPVVVSLRNYRFICPAATCWNDGKPCHRCKAGSFPWASLRHGCWRDSRPATLLSALIHRCHPLWAEVAAFVAPSAFVRDELSPLFAPRPVHVIANSLPPGIAVPQAVVSGGEERPPGIVAAGRLVAEKGMLLLARAARDVNLPLTVFGAGPESAALLAAGATLAGHRPFAEVFAAMQRARIVAVPSCWPEPFGRTALEGLAAGAAVVASAVGGLPEIVGEDGGLLVSPETCPQQWSQALLRADSEYRHQGVQGLARYREKFTGSARALEELYCQLLS